MTSDLSMEIVNKIINGDEKGARDLYHKRISEILLDLSITDDELTQIDEILHSRGLVSLPVSSRTIKMYAIDEVISDGFEKNTLKNKIINIIRKLK